MKVEITGQVMFYDTDCGGVVSNIAYLRFIEQARTMLFEQLGMEASEMTETLLFPAVVRTEIDYLSPARLGDEVRVEAHISEASRSRVTCSFDLFSTPVGEQEKISARCNQVVALVQMPSGRPKRIPPEWFNDTE